VEVIQRLLFYSVLGSGIVVAMCSSRQRPSIDGFCFRSWAQGATS